MQILIQKGENQPRKRRKIKPEDQKKWLKLVFSLQSYFKQRTLFKTVICVKN
jgi:hypothetical protein